MVSARRPAPQGKRKTWEVVGGADRGGIVVREGADLRSPQAPQRLSTGALVEQLGLAEGRLHYGLLTGTGPDEGWVSTRLGARDLVVPAGSAAPAGEGGGTGVLEVASPCVSLAAVEQHRAATLWRDLEGLAVGPWQGHSQTAQGGVSCALFDCFGTPPLERRRLYTGGWEESTVRCWDLSPEEADGPARARPAGEMQVGGFVNDIAMISPVGMLTAQSAGWTPQPGESLRAWDLTKTPFKRACLAAASSAQDALADAAAVGARPLRPAPPAPAPIDDMSQMVRLHTRGVRAVSLWPRAEHTECLPRLVGSVSKDVLAVSRLGPDGRSVEAPAAWARGGPHDGADVSALRHESQERMWSGDTKGVIKQWDTSGHGPGDVVRIDGNFGWLTGMEVWQAAGAIACSHSSGIAFVDARAGKVVHSQHTKDSCGALAVLTGGHPMLFAGVGCHLMQYDTRCFPDGAGSKPRAVGQWTLPAKVTALCCTATFEGNLLLGVGCLDGKVAAFDAA